eukprot:142866-Rhodomonas_salina.1
MTHADRSTASHFLLSSTELLDAAPLPQQSLTGALWCGAIALLLSPSPLPLNFAVTSGVTLSHPPS